jgi:uncharacterized repeat protein (TIGR03803 family)
LENWQLALDFISNRGRGRRTALKYIESSNMESSNQEKIMKIRIHRLCALTLISLLSWFAFAAQAAAQDSTFNQLSHSPKLRAKTGKTHKANAAAAGYNYEVLCSFGSSTPDGANPYAGLIQDAAGNLYGTTYAGGVNGYGTVFELDSTGSETVLHSFDANGTDGFDPQDGVIRDNDGNLYGTTRAGGAIGYGAVFKLAPPAVEGGSWTETVLYSFCPATKCTDGEIPLAGLIQDAAGNLYGTTWGGGANTSFNGGFGGGTAFKLTPPAQGGAWTETVLYSFCSATNCTDGVNPYAGLLQDAAGNLYGTTVVGGANGVAGGGDGTVFKLAPPAQPGDAWTFSVIYSFCTAAGCADGEGALSGLIQDTVGNLYGSTEGGGVYNEGTLFMLAPPAAEGDSWTETVLYSFCSASNCTDGYSPYAGLIRDTAGNLYGTAPYGGANTAANNGSGGGTVFKLAPPAQQGGTWTETALYSFCSATNCTDGSRPLYAGLLQDAAGNLYGTTYAGGADNEGAVFKLVSFTPTTTTLSLDPTSVTVGSSGPVAITAKVAPTTGTGTPTGTITFFNGTTQLSQVALLSGTASFSYNTSSLAVGTYPITATYSGDSSFAASTAPPSTLTVQAVPPSFTVAGTAVSVSPGATTGNTSTITLTPSGGFTGSVTLTAAVTSSPTGAQDLPTVSFGTTSPVSITGASAVTATLTIATTAPTNAALVRPAHPGARWYAGGTTLALGLIFGIGGVGIGIPGRRRSWRTRLGALAFLLILIGGLLACGSSGSGGGGGGGNPGTTPGAYTVTVTGTSGSTTATSTVTLTVQ